MLSASVSEKRWPRERRTDFSWSPTTSPSMLSVSPAVPSVGAKLLTLAASTSLALGALLLFRPKKARGRVEEEDGLSPRSSSLYDCVSVCESCVVALETRRGRTGLEV